LVCGLILALPTLVRFAFRRGVPLPLRRLLAARAAAPERALRLTETLVLPERASLHVVEAAGRRLLVGRSPGTLAVLYDLGASDGRPG
jgi:flagellar biogenesis protein FliO